MAIAETLPAPEPQQFSGALEMLMREPQRIGLVFQPIVDLSRGVTAGYETLARFDAGIDAPPNEWFEAAGVLGVAAELEAQVIAKALSARRSLPANCFLTINVGPGAAVTAPVQRVLRRAGDLAGVVLEITEQSPVEDYERLTAVLGTLRAAGASLAVDDAGAGFASLRHVMELRPDFVKLDRGLVANLDRDPANAATVEMMGVLAGRLDAWVIAEGVERDSELARLIELGVPLAQGFGLARPAPAMRALTTDTTGLLTTLRARRDGGGVGILQEACPEIPQGASPAQTAELLAQHPAGTVAVLVDERRRPLAMLDMQSLLDGSAARPVSLTVSPESDPREVARRAMTRRPSERFDPLVCCDERGGVLGLLRVERLVEALAR